ncbi:MAG: peptidylprolyl isomerase [Clostridia bacterium]|nr:peptidylprolyl isomerase [Clostridia bacterium]
MTMKRFLLILTAALLLFAAVGCAKQNEEEPTVKNPVATITMKDGGVMKLELYPDVAPNTVKNFISLANSGFYDGLTFHRIYAGFMIQGGDPEGNGSGDPGYSIKGEFKVNGVDNNLSHKRGVISMARAKPYDSAGCQFFIMHADYTGLDGQYAAFGMLIDGFDTLDAIAATETTYNYFSGEKSVPLEPVVIESIRVETFGVDYGEPEKIQ